MDNWETTLTDAQGDRWHFTYRGGSYVRIGAPGEGWTNTIGLDNYGLKPDTVTAAWLNERAAEWIADHDKDVAAGNL